MSDREKVWEAIERLEYEVRELKRKLNAHHHRPGEPVMMSHEDWVGALVGDDDGADDNDDSAGPSAP